MVSLVVDTDLFVEAGQQCGHAATALDHALRRAASGLSGLAQMAGSDEHGLTWAAGYDQAASQLFDYGAQLQDGVSTVARKLALTGYYYEVAEVANAGLSISSLTFPAPIAPASCLVIAAAAGGHRSFPNPNPAFTWIAEEIAKLVGGMWPDGDTDKLNRASTLWHALADDLDDVATSLHAVSATLSTLSTPELHLAHDAVQQVRTIANKLAAACREVGSACNTLSGKIAYVHSQTEITVAITIGAIAVTVGTALGLTVFTFGLSDAAGVAGVAGETAGAVAIIMGFIADLAAAISSSVAGLVAGTATLVGISADLAAIIGVAVGDISATAVLWGLTGAAENAIVTGVTEPGADLVGAAEEGFISWGAVGAGLGKIIELGSGGARVAEVVGDDGKVLRVIRETDSRDLGVTGTDTIGLLTKADQSAINDYTGVGYRNINAASRGQIPMTPELQARADAISTALAKLPDTPGTVYRGADLTPQQAAVYSPGDIVTENGFTSTSPDRYKAFGGKTVFIIDSIHGKHIAEFSPYETSENEVLFDRGSSFLVADNFVDPETGIRYITMGEVP